MFSWQSIAKLNLLDVSSSEDESAEKDSFKYVVKGSDSENETQLKSATPLKRQKLDKSYETLPVPSDSKRSPAMPTPVPSSPLSFISTSKETHPLEPVISDLNYLSEADISSSSKTVKSKSSNNRISTPKPKDIAPKMVVKIARRKNLASVKEKAPATPSDSRNAKLSPLLKKKSLSLASEHILNSKSSTPNKIFKSNAIDKVSKTVESAAERPIPDQGDTEQNDQIDNENPAEVYDHIQDNLINNRAASPIAVTTASDASALSPLKTRNGRRRTSNGPIPRQTNKLTARKSLNRSCKDVQANQPIVETKEDTPTIPINDLEGKTISPKNSISSSVAVIGSTEKSTASPTKSVTSPQKKLSISSSQLAVNSKF